MQALPLHQKVKLEYLCGYISIFNPFAAIGLLSQVPVAVKKLMEISQVVTALQGQ